MTTVPAQISDDRVILDIDGPAHGGSAVARFGEDAGARAGQVVFVRGALPGETGVPVLLDAPAGRDGTARRYLTGSVADASRIAGPSPHRTAPVCAAAAAGAGCCDLDIVDAEGSAEWKQRVVTDQFARIGHLDLEGVAVTVVSPAPYTGYRTRVRFGVDAQGRAGVRRAGSHGLVPVTEAVCAQWAPGLADGLADELGSLTLTPGAEVCVAVGDDGVRAAVELVRGNREPDGRRSVRGRRGGGVRRRIRRRVLTGGGQVTRVVNGVTWTVPAEAFWQAHQAAPELYSRWIVDTVTRDRRTVGPDTDQATPAVAWDLYGGAGVFAAALTTALPRVQVDCVDVASDSTAAGRRALGDRDVRFVTGDVAARIGDLRGADAVPEVVVLDPPRTGAGASVLEAVSARRPRHILHIGCDPATAARDAATLRTAGYRPESLTVVDAFGLTHHVEVLAHYVPVSQMERR